MSGPGRRLLGPTLKGVSRSFYLTLGVLPGGIREPVGLAYLLARAADTIADTPAVPPPLRLERLLAFRGLVQGPASLDDLDQIVAPASEGEAAPAERLLLACLPDAFSFLESLPDFDREQVRRVVTTLTHGMELDLTRFSPPGFSPPGFQLDGPGSLSAFDSPEELDRYTYLVAGCVGEFWTAVARAHEKRLSGWDVERMTALGVRFGKALQLTNVLRDAPRDLRNGRCYLPADELEAAGLSPSDLLDPSRAPQARRVLAAWTERALDHFDAAEEYLLATPRRCVRLRLAVLWPILLGLATLAVLARNESWLDPARPSRVKRKWVYWMMAQSLLAAPSDRLLRRWIGGLREQVRAGL